ncbi:MAG: hypothetical protein ACYS8W_03135 [Planctomycetota bacterium]|jgi:hypothetical protein
MDQDTVKSSAAPVAPEEEIIEKKPFHPVETSLLIVSFLVLCFAIYLICDELGFYTSANDYKTGVKAADSYQQFADNDRIEMVPIVAETESLRP